MRDKEQPMLVLSRKRGESIVIGRRIYVTVDRVDRHRVRLAIDAPEDVSVDRREIWVRKHEGVRPVATDAVD